MDQIELREIGDGTSPWAAGTRVGFFDGHAYRYGVVSIEETPSGHVVVAMDQPMFADTGSTLVAFDAGDLFIPATAMRVAAETDPYVNLPEE